MTTLIQTASAQRYPRSKIRNPKSKMVEILQSKIQNPKSKIKSNACIFLSVSIILSVALFLFAPMALADDVGITKARLIQKSAKSYQVEADVSRALVWAIKAPIFPDRFRVSELEFINQSGWIVVQATATTEGSPLTAKDEILLP